MAESDVSETLANLSPIQLFPFAVLYGNGVARRYTTLPAAKAAANHYVASKPTIYSYNFATLAWEEYK